MTTHEDLHRDIGRMEGGLNAVKDRMDRLERTVDEGFEKLESLISDMRADINTRLVPLETAESQRKGAIAAIIGVASLLSGALGALISNLIGG